MLETSVACGIGFSILENALILAQNAATVTLYAAIVRGIGAGMMHALCTFAVGYGISLFIEKKKWIMPGTIALIIAAMTYHSLYNILIQSQYMLTRIVLTVATYIVILIAKHFSSAQSE